MPVSSAVAMVTAPIIWNHMFSLSPSGSMFASQPKMQPHLTQSTDFHIVSSTSPFLVDVLCTCKKHCMDVDDSSCEVRPRSGISLALGLSPCREVNDAMLFADCFKNSC